MVSSLGYNFTMATLGIGTVDVPDLFVKLRLEACICNSKGPMTLELLEPNNQVEPPISIFSCMMMMVLDTDPLSSNNYCSTYMVPT